MRRDAKANILLVDDRQENLLALEAVLEELGQNLLKATSGEEALKWVLREDFAVILLDVQMPGMSGFETARLIKLRERSRTIPIIFITAINKEDDYVFEGYSVGAVDYLFKPFDPRILRSKVAVFVDLALKQRQIERQAEEIAAQKRCTELILTSAGEGIFGVDARGRFNFVNPAGAALLGYHVHELLARPAHSTLVPTDKTGAPYSEEASPIRRALRDGTPRRFTDMTLRRRDGSVLPVDVVCTPIREACQTIGAVITFMDVTERRQAEEAMRRHATELEQAYQQLRDTERYKDEFLSVISHELRTPLNLITGFGEMLDDEVAGPLTPDQHDFMKQILEGSNRLQMLVNDLLDVATLQAGSLELHPVPTPYPEIVTDVLATFEPMARQKGLSLTASVPDSLIIDIDGPRIAHVLANLVSNAVKFTPKGGSVRINVYRDGQDLVTEVRDTGIGLAEEDIPKLFHRFRQLDMSTTRTAGGTGLGLSIAKDLVEAHGGTITAMSAGLDKGSVFSFTLPFVHGERGAGEPFQHGQEGAAGRRDEG